MSVILTDELSCPLCAGPLIDERYFHTNCADDEQARADFDPGTDDADDWAIADRMRYDRG